jgi:hypothetical protein
MKLVLEDKARELLAAGVQYVESHFDEIDPYFLHLTRDEVAAVARFIAGPGGEIGSRAFSNLTMLALVLEGLAADGRVSLPEDALRAIYERLKKQ